MLKISSVGEQQTLIFIINGATTPALARDAFFNGDRSGSLNHFFFTCSYAQTWFVGEIAEVQFQMPAQCDPALFARLAMEAAEAKGYDLDAYTRHAYVGKFPCPWGGMGSGGYNTRPSGTEYSAVWLNGLGAWNHEMGHAFSLAHSNMLGWGERTDPTCEMGRGGGREFNAPQRANLRWLYPLDIVSGGYYQIYPLELPGAALYALRIPKPDSDEWYWLSYRQPIGPYDGYMQPGLVKGVSLHVVSPPEVNGPALFPRVTKLVNFSTDPKDFSNAAMSDGQSFYDSQNRIRITQLSHNSEAASVSIEFGADPPPPPPPPPQLEITPSTVTLRAGETQQFIANVPVTWRLSGKGSLTTEGLYTAPSRINKSEAAAVTATAGSSSASASVLLVRSR